MPAKMQRQPMAQAVGKGQGRGVTALFEDTSTPGTELEGARELPLGLIDPNPYQPRQAFDAQSLQELADSIGEHGVLEPILVRPSGDRYQIVVGERRFRATGMAGLDRIPALIREMDDAQAAIAATVENLQREDLDIEDEARRFSFLLELTGLSQRKLAEKLGVNHVYLSRRVKLLKRPDLMEAYRSGRMMLHEVVSRVEETQPGEGVSGGNSDEEWERISQESNPNADVELIERDDLTGYIVSRGNSPVSARVKESSATPFRWRPALQFRNWLNRLDPVAVPAGERASFRAQITEIKAKLEEWEKVLEVAPEGPEQTAPEGNAAVDAEPLPGAALDSSTKAKNEK